MGDYALAWCCNIPMPWCKPVKLMLSRCGLHYQTVKEYYAKRDEDH